VVQFVESVAPSFYCSTVRAQPHRTRDSLDGNRIESVPGWRSRCGQDCVCGMCGVW